MCVACVCVCVCVPVPVCVWVCADNNVVAVWCEERHANKLFISKVLNKARHFYGTKINFSLTMDGSSVTLEQPGLLPVVCRVMLCWYCIALAMDIAQASQLIDE